MVQPVMNRSRPLRVSAVVHLGILLFTGASLAAAEGTVSDNSAVPPVPNAHHVPIPLPQNPPAVPALSADQVLAWDKETKDQIVPHGTVDTKYTFFLTNISPAVVTITGVHTSCGCTAAQLPEIPWNIPAGGTGEINVTMNVANKVGLVAKTVTVNTDKGPKVLFVKTTILPPTAAQMAGDDRSNNQKIALADRQAVFRGDCARCHSASENKFGHELFVSVCGVCHEAEHRAAMVPDLKTLKHPTNAEYWRNWITHGKAGTLMPAFSKKEEGILTDEQIESLVKYLSETIPTQPAASGAKPQVQALPRPQSR